MRWLTCLVALASLGTAPAWTPVPIRTADQAKGNVGGEGSQWPRGPVAISSADPRFLLLPIDVGGVYRSLDGGASWKPAMVGWTARGANAFAIDPTNADRALGVAGNSINWDANWGPSPHGLYLSTDQAASWRHVLPLTGGFAGGVAFDPSSRDETLKGCRRAYFMDDAGKLFRSGDGGGAWAEVNAKVVTTPTRDWTQGGTTPTMLRVDRRGRVWAAGVEGVFRSADRGKTFAKLRDGVTLGLSLTADGEAIFVSGPDGAHVSRDDGKTFVPLPLKGLDRGDGGPVHGIVASPVDPRRLLCWTVAGQWNWPRFASVDGGLSWTRSTLDPAGSILPTNCRQGYLAWHPTDPNVAFSIGGDYVSRSVDGGKTFRWSNSGNGGVMVGGTFTFNPRAPDVLFLGFQDYNGAFTTDGGKTWHYRDVSGLGWGGHVYAAAAIDARTMFACVADGWGSPRKLRVTRDAGATWSDVAGADGKPVVVGMADASFLHPTDAKVAFAGDHRTADGGDSWTKIDGCDAVYAADAKAGVLFGRAGGDRLVVSRDAGVTWTMLATIDGGFRDLAVDGTRGRVYAASSDRLKWVEADDPGAALWYANVRNTLEVKAAHDRERSARWRTKVRHGTLDTPKDARGNTRVHTVAVDPVDPSIVYASGPANIYATDATIVRSTDAGKTWTNLTVTTPLANAGATSGPREVSMIRVHPVTREAWAAGQCFGVWKLAARK